MNDDTDLLALLRHVLARRGYAVTTAVHDDDPFDRIVTAAPDALLLALEYLDGAGWALLARLHADPRTRDIPLVLGSTSAASLRRVQANPARYGAHRTSLAMPFDADELLAALFPLLGPA